MCFTTLPPELQEEIIIDLEKPDLYSLCLVSKSLLHLARPLLYRSVELHPDSWQRAQEDVARDMWMSCDGEEDAVEFMDKAKADFEGREYHRNKLIKTFEAHQDWKKFVQKVTIDFNVSAEGSSQASQLGRLLSSCPNLRTLAINSAYHNATGSFLLQHTPPSLRSLDFEYSQLPAEFILRLLNKLPLVETLSLADDKPKDSSLSFLTNPVLASTVFAHSHSRIPSAALPSSPPSPLPQTPFPLSAPTSSQFKPFSPNGSLPSRLSPFSDVLSLRTHVTAIIRRISHQTSSEFSRVANPSDTSRSLSQIRTADLL